MQQHQRSVTDKKQADEVLTLGNLTSPELILDGSNDTFLVAVSYESQTLDAVYKPSKGERPLWDFQSGTLYKREYASYLISQALCWDFIPCTVIREGPFGTGSVQEFIESNPQSNYFTLRYEYQEQLEAIALFDCLANNADRKATHCFADRAGKIWSIDHGLTFHQEPKLRTVIWDFSELQISTPLLHNLSNFLDNLLSASMVLKHLTPLLTADELTALALRAEQLLASRYFPAPDYNRRNIPWPWI